MAAADALHTGRESFFRSLLRADSLLGGAVAVHWGWLGSRIGLGGEREAVTSRREQAQGLAEPDQNCHAFCESPFAICPHLTSYIHISIHNPPLVVLSASPSLSTNPSCPFLCCLLLPPTALLLL